MVDKKQITIYKYFSYSLLLSLGLALVAGCMKTPASDSSSGSGTNSNADNGSQNYLYVSSGSCYQGGGNTTFTNLTSSNLVFRVNMVSGARDTVIADYNASPSNYGDSPVGIVNADPYLYVLIENTTTASLRRIEKIEKKSEGARSIYSNNTTALSAQLRHIFALSDGYFLVSKSSAVEKVKDGTNRLLAPGTAYPWLNLASAPASSGCITNTTLISSVVTLNNGNIVFAHAGTNLNRIGLVSASGYTATASCLNGNAVVSAPATAAFPTAMVYDKVNNKLLVSYAGSGTAADINSIYAYPVNESTNTIGAGVKIYDANLFGTSPGWSYLLYGISAMTLDPATNSLYVATAITTATTVVNDRIEKLTYDPTQIGVNNYQVLTRSSSVPFYDYGSDTKCITDLFVGP